MSDYADSKDGGPMRGNHLFNTVVGATGLPEEPIRHELEKLILAAGKEPDTLSLEDLREVLADYLQTVLVQTKDDLSA
jgi:hypothetical protein